MNRPLLLKSFAVGLLALLLLVPLAMIEGTIAERASYRDAAQSEIADTYAGSQRVTGPVLVIPYVETVRTVARAGVMGEVSVTTRRVDRQLAVFPEELAVDGEVEVQARRRGIFETQVWRARELEFAGRFVVPALPGASTPSSEVSVSVAIGEPYIAFGLSDLRGLLSTPAIDIDGHRQVFAPRPAPPFEGSAVRAAFPGQAVTAGQVVTFRMSVDLGGTRELAIVPLGGQTQVNLRSNWPHPSFGGRFLPLEREVSDAGFTAQWRVPAIASNARTLFDEPGEGAAQRARLTPLVDALAVRLIQPADVYAQAARAAKYGALFVVLTFGAFWLFEAMRQVVIHPVQYGFVGAALAIFFLLLLALSEHIAFAVAYLVAAGACIALIGVYLASVLRSARTAALFSSGLAALYGSLFAVIRLEDTALLIGSLLLFAALATAMLVSRRLDWSRWGGSGPGRVGAPHAQPVTDA
jgi:inner membrane protein